MIFIDKIKCIGCGTCEAMCSNIFEVVDGKSKVKKDKLEEKDTECAREAEKACPTQAIKVS